MNLPFELGMDIGCKNFSHNPQHNSKKILILETNRFDYRVSLSDISGYDIKSHSDNPHDLIKAIRDWFVENHIAVCDKSPQYILDQYAFFYGDLYIKRRDNGYTVETINEIPVNELLSEISSWLEEHHH